MRYLVSRIGRGLVVAALAVAILTTVAAYVGDAAADDAPQPLGPGDVTIALGMEYSRFDVTEISVRSGTRLRFVVTNHDPIPHELIVGDEEVHAQHATGTHAGHPPIPGEVTVRPGGIAVTTFTFDEPGVVNFACHLPGHYDYGMHGRIVVTD